MSIETDTDAALKRLQSARDYLASIVESSADAIIAKRLDGTVTAWNPAAERLFGYAAFEMIGHPILKLFPPELLAEEEDIIARVRSGATIEPYETRRLRKDGSEIFVSLTVSPIRNTNGEVVGAAKIVRDITERKQAQARLEGLQAELIHLSRWNMMGSISSSLAHELNQPLAAMTNYLAALKRVIANQPDNKKLLNEIAEKATQQGQRAAAIVQHLREMVAKGKSERKAESLAGVLREAIELIGTMLRQCGVTVIIEVARDLPPVEIDRVQIQQVIINLARNAAEAMADSPIRELRIAATREADAVRIDVADTGPGLPPAVSEHLFEAFVTTKPSGMGLGLSICDQIVRAHGDLLSASPNQPQGTVFSFTVPLAQAAVQ